MLGGRVARRPIPEDSDHQPDDGGDIEHRVPAEIVDDEGDQRRRDAGTQLGAALHPGIGLAALMAGKPGGDEQVGGWIGQRLAQTQDEAHAISAQSAFAMLGGTSAVATLSTPHQISPPVRVRRGPSLPAIQPAGIRKAA